MSEYKIIHFHLFRPDKAIFKINRNSKAVSHTISCCNSNNCHLFNKGECSLRNTFTSKTCPYGKYLKNTGFSSKSLKYNTWIKSQLEKYEDIACLKIPVGAVSMVGDYVYLPYSFMNMFSSLDWKGYFLKKENFTIDTIISLIYFKPHAIFGGEILDYQEKVVPIFLKHLSESYPDIFENILEKDNSIKTIIANFSNIGRKAILETLSPNVGFLKDIYGNLWNWDGKKLSCCNIKPSFMLIREVKKVILIPEEKQVVTITDEKQVNDSTIFMN